MYYCMKITLNSGVMISTGWTSGDVHTEEKMRNLRNDALYKDEDITLVQDGDNTIIRSRDISCIGIMIKKTFMEKWKDLFSIV